MTTEFVATTELVGHTHGDSPTTVQIEPLEFTVERRAGGAVVVECPRFLYDPETKQ